jgi:hypothetical protein
MCDGNRPEAAFRKFLWQQTFAPISFASNLRRVSELAEVGEA